MDHIRVWVYQANRKLTNDDVQFLEQELKPFIDQWKAHGQDLQAGFEILHNAFVVLKVDQQKAQASGCSVDASVNFMKDLQTRIGVDFFDRQMVNYEDANGKLNLIKLDELGTKVEAGEITDDTLIFNPLVQNLSEYQSQFKIPFRDSWHKNLLKQGMIPT